MDSEFSFEKDPNFLELKKIYRMHPIVLYTGAGASWSRSDEYGLGGWNGFIERIIVEYGKFDDASLSEFHEKSKYEWESEPWKMADWIAEKCGKPVFRDLVASLISQIITKNSTKASFIHPGFLKNAPTLNAITAFCCEVLGVTNLLSMGMFGPSVTYHYAPNHRIRAIITSNYDPFLYLASSKMYQTRLFNPVAPGNLFHHTIPIFHIHGYVPPQQDMYRLLSERLKKTVNDKVRKAMITESKDMYEFINPVLTSQDYSEAWEQKNMYSNTVGPQIHYLKHFTSLFIGFSFRDKWVLNLLKDIKQEKRDPTIQTFAILSKNEVELKGDSFYDEYGISPIALNDFSELPNLLGAIYQEGIIKDHGTLGERVQLYPSLQSKRYKSKKKPPMEYLQVSPKQYWTDLFTCRDREVTKEWKDTITAY